MIIKCKMCGGDMELSADQRTGTCEYCGSTMTLPKVDDEQRAAAFNRGNHFRRIGEFDKALTVYETIVRENENDAEAHWCCALCRFGIEYVKDPVSGEYLPTCHRASFDSFLEDVDYKAALEHADVVARSQYQKDAEKIAQVQKGILSISQKEEPFDVFICYKESDERGNRTVDSTLAQDIYYQLTEQGRKVFFARITLEDKVGQEYEPYIFAALHSAKVMVVVGTKPEYLNAVWVKNEWSRYLALMKNDRKRLLIPCYRDMDPYDLPEQLSVLQSYDMSKIGFIQDLIRGIAKVLDADKKTETKVVEHVIEHGAGGAAPGIDSLMKRIYLFLEDGDFNSANEYIDRVLDIDPNYAPAYAARVCTALQFRRESQLGEATFQYDRNQDWKKALRFANTEQKSVYEEYARKTEDRVRQQIRDYTYDCWIELAVNPSVSEKVLTEELEKYKSSCLMTEPGKRCNGLRRKNYEENEKIFRTAVETKEPCDVTEAAYQSVAKLLNEIGDGEAIADAKQCLVLAEQARQKAVYIVAAKSFESGSQSRNAAALLAAADSFQSVPEYKDAIARAERCRELAEAIQKEDYQAAVDVMKAAGTESQKWRNVWDMLKSPNLDGYRDAEQLRQKAEEQYQKCLAEEERIRKEKEARKEREEKRRQKKKIIIGAAVVVVAMFAFIVNIKVIQPSMKYKEAESLMAAGEYEAAAEAFTALGDYSDASDKILEAKYKEAESLMTAGEYEAASEAFAALGDYSDAAERVLEPFYQEAESLLASGEYEAASEAFAALGDYSDAADRVLEPYYVEGTKYLQEQKYLEAAKVLMGIRGYRDVDALFAEHTELYDAYFSVGNEVFFGSYEQDGNTGNGAEDIEWLVLDKEGDKVLLLSKYGLDAKPYNTEYIDVTWETCTLRTWLNQEFLNTAFTSEEQAAIQETEVDNSQSQCYSGYDSRGGNNTQDQVFLLSYKEAFEDYFTNDKERICKPTAYAVKQGAIVNNGAWWWLRSPGYFQDGATHISDDGSRSSIIVNYDTYCVRPALWINLESDIF